MQWVIQKLKPDTAVNPPPPPRWVLHQRAEQEKEQVLTQCYLGSSQAGVPLHNLAPVSYPIQL